MTVLRAYRQLLRNGPLTRLLVGEFVSSIGDWLYLLAILILVYQVTEDPFVLGLVGAARVLPYVFLSVPAGIVADRFDRRLVLLSTDVARGLLMLVIAGVVFVDGPIWLVVALTIGATCFATFFGPAIGAYLPTLVEDEEQLGPANSAWSTLDNLAYMVGPAVAGILIATGGLAVAFLLNAASFAVIAVVLWGLPRNAAAAASEAVTIAPDAAPGVTPGAEAAPTERAAPASLPAPAIERRVLVPILGLALIEVIGAVVGGGLSVLTVIIATTGLGGGEEATGFLNAGMGLGGFIGALVAGALVLRPSLVPLLVGGSLVYAIGLAGLGFAPALGAAIAAITIAAAGSLVIEVSSMTVFQRVVPDGIRGRTLGVLGTVSTVALAIGSLVIPILADAVGTGPVMAACGVAVAVAGLGGALMAATAARRRAGSTADVRVNRLAGLPLFAGVPAAALEAIAVRMEPRRVAAGEVVIREGDVADRFYLIDEGQFDVTRLPGGGLEAAGAAEHLRTMGPGEVFGEIGLLRGIPRTATVTAATDGALLALDGADFLELVNAGPLVRPRLLDLRRGAPGAGY
ncbi:MAG TPA: MFS transporter [Candidatus Nanopelagicales bacterium]|nr:MFS transporter [Candidatus Nanopelagicales bacterium]